MKYTKNHIIKLNKQLEKYFPNIFPITEDMKNSRKSISRLVMLDRYSQKDIGLKSLEIGDLIIVKIKPDPSFPTLGIGFVKKVNSETVVVKLEEEYIGQIDLQYTQKIRGEIEIRKSEISKPIEIFYEQISKRVGSNLASLEKDPKWIEKFTNQIKDEKIVPAGRVLFGAGSNAKVTYFNCYVMPMPKDSREGIAEHRKEVLEIMSRGGGVGTNGSTLRPRFEILYSTKGISSGSVSWLNDISKLTHLVEQGGSRRGAQMIMLSSWHPDILEFIISKMQNIEILNYIKKNFKDKKIQSVIKNKMEFVPLTQEEKNIYKIVIKSNDLKEKEKKNIEKKLIQNGYFKVRDTEFLSGANISVAIDDKFMKAIKEDKDYSLKFPDLKNLDNEQRKFYEENWHNIGDINEWEKLNLPTKIYDTIKARTLWNLLTICSTYSAEPGIFFLDRANSITNAKSYDQKIVCTNPCGEQPLAPYSVCNLAAINLSNFIEHKKDGKILWKELKETVSIMVRLQDNVIDNTPYFLKTNERQAKGERRIGMGIMGLHDLLIWAGLEYGSSKGNELIEKIMKIICEEAYIASSKLAKEKGSFPFFQNIDKLLNTGFVKNLSENVKVEILKNKGLRNSHLLTIAPTGSTGTMLSVSTGLEPYFAFKYYRSGRLGQFIEVDQKIVEEWKKANNWNENKKLPSFFKSAMDLTPKQHVDVQTTIQKWVDSSISKTINAPKGYTVEQVNEIYHRLYDNGAKGGTVYVDGSRNSQVLSLIDDDKEEKQEIKETKLGIGLGETCPICKKGVIENLGGCNTCVNCGMQLKCDV